MKPTYNEYKELTVEALELYHAGDFEEALFKFLYLAEHNPNNAKVHEMLAYLYLKKDNLEKAEQEYQIYKTLLVSENSYLEIPERSFEDVVQDAGDFEELSEEYNRIMSKDRELDLFEDGHIASALSLHYFARGDYQSAEQVLENFKAHYESMNQQVLQVS